jgi:hypothetical protein
MANLYSTLLTSEFALLGILIAVVFVYVQLVATQFTNRATQVLLSDFRLLFFVITCVITIVVTAIASLALAVPAASDWVLPFLTYVGVTTKLGDLVKNTWVVVVCLGMVLSSVLLFISTIYRYASYTNTPSLLKAVSRKINPYLVVAHLSWRENAGNKPDNRFIAALRGFVCKMFGRFVTRFGVGICAPDDPIAPLIDIGVNSVSRHDLETWQKTIAELTQVILQVVRAGITKPQSLVDAQEESNIQGSALAEYLVERYLFLIETVDEAGHSSLEVDVLTSSQTIIAEFIGKQRNWFAASVLLGFVEQVGSHAIANSNKRVTSKVIQILTNSGETSTVEGNAEGLETQGTSRDLFDKVCRIVGNLGERILIRGIPQQPLMPSSSSTDTATELDEIDEALAELKDCIVRQKKPFDALILLDAIDVLSKRLISNPSLVANVEGMLAGLWYYAVDIAIHASEADDIHNMYLCCVRLRQAYDLVIHSNHDWSSLPRDIAQCLIEIGIRSKKVKDTEDVGRYIFERDVDRDQIGLVLQHVKHILPEHRDGAIKDTFMHYAPDNYDEGWKFVTRAGKLLGRNFDLNFDPETGEHYPKEQ